MTPQLAEMTSKCFLPQPSTNDQCLALGGDPPAPRVNRGTPTAARNKEQTSAQPARPPSMEPCYARRSVGRERREEQACEAQG